MTLNQSTFDGWSLVHIASGALLASIGVSRGASLALLVAFEVIERPVFDTRPETLRNQLGDILAGVAGYEGIRYLESSSTA